MRQPFVAGNWKMNTDAQGAVALAQGIAAQVSNDDVTVALCPPFVYLAAVTQAVGTSPVAVGAQDLYFEANGAFTGEISTAMLRDVGCSYVLCGHSERRHVIGEDNALINKKLRAALAAGLKPILCIGELLDERDADRTEAVCEVQLKEGLAGVTAAQMADVTLAYEPVWAIGTGRTATPQQAQDVHAFVRGLLADLYDGTVAQATRIQYGGSAKPGNAAELLGQADVDGLLVGGASLKIDDFVAIINAAR